MKPSAYLAVIESLALVPDIVVPLVREVPAPILKKRPAPGKWSAHEHACHLASVQPMFFDRLDLMLNTRHPSIKPYLPDKDDAEDALLKADLSAEMERFVKDRERLVALLRKLKEADWDRTADHGEYNRYSVFILFRHVVMHDMLHAYRIEELLLKKEW